MNSGIQYQEETKMRSPFKYIGPILPEDVVHGCTFVDRRHLLREIASLVSRGSYVQVIGPNQSGRTTLANALARHYFDRYHDYPSPVSHLLLPLLVNCADLSSATTTTFVGELGARVEQVIGSLFSGAQWAKLRDSLERKRTTSFSEFRDTLINLGDLFPVGSAFIFMVRHKNLCRIIFEKQGLTAVFAVRNRQGRYRRKARADREDSAKDIGNQGSYCERCCVG
jgi:hypothetical protein